MVEDFVKIGFGLVQGFLSVLPASFVSEWINSNGALQYLSYVNFFIPFDVMSQIGATWLSACGAYLVYHFARNAYNNVKNGD